ncbi:MAG: hypothetical protein KIS92_26120, partial [Planctomycetota bacterium]|nr:hypothetical protein [Planctomycetota bacterium]
EAAEEELARKHDLLRAAAAWAYWLAFDETVKPLAAKLLGGNRVRAEALVRWQAVMRDVMQLSQDVSVFLPRAANECAYAGEAARRHYDSVNERFALGALLDTAGAPTPWAHPFLKKP